MLNDADMILMLRDALEAIAALSKDASGTLGVIHEAAIKALQQTDLEETKHLRYDVLKNDAGRDRRPGH